MGDGQPQRPSKKDDRDAWSAHWQAQGMPWRTEPEIDAKRQRFLAERRAVTPDIERDIYPFHHEHGGIKLTRADVEWLLAAFRPWLGPAGWDDERERARLKQLGYDDARIQAQLDRMRSTITDARERTSPRLVRSDGYDICIQGVVLHGADLAGADLHGLDLVGADLRSANLASANLSGCDLEEASLDYSRRYWNEQRPSVMVESLIRLIRTSAWYTAHN